MIVMKFGGTSVEDADAIRRVAKIVRGRLDQRPVVVVSAMAKVTDSLLAASQTAASGALHTANKLLRQLRQRHLSTLAELVKESEAAPFRDALTALFDNVADFLRSVAALGELSGRSVDNIVSTGELLSTQIVTAALVAEGMPALAIDSRRCVVTDSNFTRALPLFDKSNAALRRHLKPLVADGRVPIMGGFIGSTADGIPTTLGRGGSDYSAAIVGAALRARRIEIWTDVDGMMTTDPRACPQARKIDVIGFDEAAELAYFGAKVLHPATLVPAIEKNIPVYVLNSRNPKGNGTCIRAHAKRSRHLFRAIAFKMGATVINVKSPRMLMAHGFLRALFETLDHHALAPDLISTSEVSVSLTLDSSRDLSSLVKDLQGLGSVEVESQKAIVCLVGEDIKGRVGIAASVFRVVADAGINTHMISQGASEINISFVVDDGDALTAVRELHRHFFENDVLDRNQGDGGERQPRANTRFVQSPAECNPAVA
jgi:aspartate kinase